MSLNGIVVGNEDSHTLDIGRAERWDYGKEGSVWNSRLDATHSHDSPTTA